MSRIRKETLKLKFLLYLGGERDGSSARHPEREDPEVLLQGGGHGGRLRPEQPVRQVQGPEEAGGGGHQEGQGRGGGDQEDQLSGLRIDLVKTSSVRIRALGRDLCKTEPYPIIFSSFIFCFLIILSCSSSSLSFIFKPWLCRLARILGGQ
jgi:hypothetical protein